MPKGSASNYGQYSRIRGSFGKQQSMRAFMSSTLCRLTHGRLCPADISPSSSRDGVSLLCHSIGCYEPITALEHLANFRPIYPTCFHAQRYPTVFADIGCHVEVGVFQED